MNRTQFISLSIPGDTTAEVTKEAQERGLSRSAYISLILQYRKIALEAHDAWAAQRPKVEAP